MGEQICSIEGCERTHFGRGWCSMHYKRWWKHGDPLGGKPQWASGINHPNWKGGPHPLRQTYDNMLRRCRNPNDPDYQHYGGRGITVCERWRDDFWNFVEDMGERPDGRTLDRIDNDGHYNPANCRWSTHKEQVHNRRTIGSLQARVDELEAENALLKQQVKEWQTC